MENEIKVTAFSQKIIYIVLIQYFILLSFNIVYLYTVIIIQIIIFELDQKKDVYIFFSNKIFLRAFVYRGGGGKWKILIIAEISF